MTRDRYLPPSGTKAERRRWQREDDEDARRALTARPNEPPAKSPYTNCHDSVYLVHRFIPDGKGGRRCSLCHKPEEQCLRPGAKL